MSKDSITPKSDKDTSSTARPSPANDSPSGREATTSTNAPTSDEQPSKVVDSKPVQATPSSALSSPEISSSAQMDPPLLSVPLDPSAMMILQSVDPSAGAGSPGPFDPSRLNLYQNAPLVALSPALGHPAQPQLVAPGTPVATYSPSNPSDWSHQYLQIASLQSMTAAGFLSPAGHPVSPSRSPVGEHDPRMWPDVSPRAAGTGGVEKPVPNSPMTLPIPAENGGPTGHMHVVDSSGVVTDPSGFATLHAQQASLTNSPYGAAWLAAASKGGAFCVPVAAQVMGGDEQHALTAFPVAAGQTPEASQFHTAADPGRMVDTVLHAKSLTEQLLRDFTLESAVDVLRTALSLLGRAPAAGEASGDGPAYSAAGDGLGGEPSIVTANGSLPSVKLVHPDEFKNPSTFLKIYGDPLCFTRNGPLPKKGRNGNWECAQCSNVNFPRRFRCNMCGTPRHEEGDRVVSDYARQVYERYLFIYKNQQQMTADGEIHIQPVQQASNMNGSAQFSRGGSNNGNMNPNAASHFGQQQPSRNLHPMHPAHAGAAGSSFMANANAAPKSRTRHSRNSNNVSRQMSGAAYGQGLINHPPHLIAQQSATAMFANNGLDYMHHQYGSERGGHRLGHQEAYPALTATGGYSPYG